MGRTATQNVDMNFRARDAGASATIKAVQGSVSRMPEQLAKSATALNAFGGSVQSLGGKTADLANKLTGVGALVATGGPVGIAIAAVTVAVGGATKMWEAHQAPVVAARNAYNSLVEALRESQQRLERQGETISTMRRELEFWGVSSNQARKTELEQILQKQTKTLPAYKAEIQAAKEKAAALEQERAELMASGLTIINDSRLRAERLVALKQESEGLREKARLMEVAVPQLELSNQQAKAELSLLTQKIAYTERDANAAAQKAAAKQREANARRQNAAAAREEAAAQRDLDAARGEAARQRESDLTAQDAEVTGIGNNISEMEARLGGFARSAGAGMVDLSAKTAGAAKDAASAWESSAIVMSSAIGQGFGAMIVGAEDAGKQMLKSTLRAAQSAIQVYAVQAAAGAAASASFLGPVGMAFASSLAFGIVNALLETLPSFQHGGVVPGVDTGRDTVVAGLRPGERVFTPEDNERMVQALERGAGSGGSVTVNFNSVHPATSAEAMRAVRATRKQQQRLVAMGMAV